MGVEVDPAVIKLPTAPPELQQRLDAGETIAWTEPMTIETYDPADPNEYPMFLDRRVYQGSSGRVYPLPFIDRIASESRPREWQAIHLENRYLRLVILPELGGRIHIAYDKTNGYDFFYRNNVIKPALVGLAGPWISGGVEFNWPQHHRPATYLPVETTISLEDSGAITVWCSDHDPLSRMKGMHGIRLHPDRAVIELAVRLHNRTSERHTFLWWANVAVEVNDDYQSFFPTDVRYVADHARRAITAFPAADRSYYGVDYPARERMRPGANRIDFHSNIPVPTSYMVLDTDDEFFGGYDHGVGAGFVHWADRRISPGKKQWTWGNSPFGDAWYAHLADDDSAYVELMAGVYTDNQPDFAWIMPGETKTFSQYWYPIQQIGVAHQANRDAAVHVEVGITIDVGVSVTRSFTDATIRVADATDATVAEWRADLAPGDPFSGSAPNRAALADVDLTTEVLDSAGSVVISWRPRPVQICEEPAAATEPSPPTETSSVDELYLVGVHLAQYRHPTRSPLPFWEEALRRDPRDSRVNLALAWHHYGAADYARALSHLDAAIARLTERNGTPADGEPFYAKGLILRRLGRTREAVAAFAKAAWDGKWAHAAGYEMARIALADGRPEDAIADAAECARYDTDDLRQRALTVIALRRLGRTEDAERLLTATRHLDRLDVLCRVLDGEMPTDMHGLVDVAADLDSFGEHSLALTLLDRAALANPGPAGNVGPIAHYLRASILDRLGMAAEAAAERAGARSADRRWAFPAGLDAHDALHDAIVAEPEDTVAHGFLGMLLFDRGRTIDAMDHWQRAIALGTDDPIIFRNAGIAAYNVLADDRLAWVCFERAWSLAPRSARLLYELNQLAGRLGHPANERLARLEAHRDLVLSRDDLVVDFSELLVGGGRAAEAVALLESRIFQPWEGGEGRVLAVWEHARTAAGLSIESPPSSLGEARPEVTAPPAVREDGTTDYFATSLPDLLLFARDPG
jgi:tetratricopeptide (TPR) repeat protein